MTHSTVFAAPALDTGRLTLRGHTPDDFDECAAMWGDPQVTRYIGGRPSTQEEVWTRLLRYAGMWALLGLGYWVVRERETGRFVGEVGFSDFRREMTPPLGSDPRARPRLCHRGRARRVRLGRRAPRRAAHGGADRAGECRLNPRGPEVRVP
jgi:RimJ/RimL family protein N-acetyltransferase